MEKLKDVCELKYDLIEAVKQEIAQKGGIYSDGVNAHEIGMVIDMIKDLAKTEKDCIEACYYETVIEAMGGEIDRPGYDHWRYSSGRFAPKGSGHYSRAGYPMMSPTIYNAHMMEDHEDRMGYPMSQTGNVRTVSRSGYPIRHDSYEDYQNARRHYHETHSDNDRMIMNHHMDQHINDVTDSVRDIWEDATPEQKKKIKGSMSKLLAEMQV